MIQFLEFTIDQAIIIAIALPIVAVCLISLVILCFRNGSGSMLRRYLSYLVSPPQIGSHSSVTPEDDKGQEHTARWREIKVKLFFFYLGTAIFLISITIGEFYEVIFDIILPVSQGSTEEMRILTSVIFQSPFSAGWTGSLPWYGQLPLPSGLGTYHESWSWIFATAAFTDNPNFLGSVVTLLLLMSIGVGFVFLLPLAIKRIRHSFLPSMFFFMTGMVIFTKAAIGCMAQVLALAYGNSTIQYGLLVITGDMIPDLSQVLAIGIPIILALFALFTLLGWKLWQKHYTDMGSRRWFMLYVALSYWLGLALTIAIL